MPDYTPSQYGTYHMVGDSNYEPMRTNNFELQILGLTSLVSPDRGVSMPSNSGDIITLSVASFQAPSVSINPITIQYGNNSIKYAGKPTFSDSSLVVNDYIGLDIERIIVAWQTLVYNMGNQKIGLASSYKQLAYLMEYAPDGSSYREWEIHGCWPSNIQMGEFSQEGGAVRQITVTITYDYALPIDN